jgi:hypothetical protein
MRFEERYSLLQGGIANSDPAWVCQNHACGYEERVRSAE